MSRKLSERSSRRSYILAAARELFAERGIDEPTMDDIAAAAEYTRQTLYAYFKNRDEILLRVLCGDLCRRWELQQAALAGIEGCGAKLRVWAGVLFDFWKKHPQAMRLEFFWDYHGIDAELVGAEALGEFSRINDELAEGLRAIVSDGITSGALRSDLNCDMCISQFLQCQRATAYRALSRSYSFAEFESESYFEHYLDIFLAGIRGDITESRGETS